MIKGSSKFTLFLLENIFKSVIKIIMHTLKAKTIKFYRSGEGKTKSCIFKI